MSNKYGSSATTSYVIYNSPASVGATNKNSSFSAPPSEFPRKLYKGSPMNPTRTQPLFYREAGALPYPRDTEVDYFLHVDRDVHPPHQSRFGYPWCENGYCFGLMNGKYNTPPGMQWMSNIWPEDMAPKRFYQGVHRDFNYCDSEAYIGARQARAARASGF